MGLTMKYRILNKEPLYHKIRYTLQYEISGEPMSKDALLAELDGAAGAPFGGDVDYIGDNILIATIYTD